MQEHAKDLRGIPPHFHSQVGNHESSGIQHATIAQLIRCGNCTKIHKVMFFLRARSRPNEISNNGVEFMNNGLMNI